MILVNELLKYEDHVPEATVYLFTANSVVKANGELVMGAGNAKAVRDTYKGIAKSMGELIHMDLPTVKAGSGYISAFKVKHDWKDMADMALVERSLDTLLFHASLHKKMTFHLPMPAVGLGGLPFDEVKDMLQVLPNNVKVYYV